MSALSGRRRVHPAPHVEEHGAGFRPVCRACAFQGKVRSVKKQAEAALQHHVASKGHLLHRDAKPQKNPKPTTMEWK